MGTISGCRHMKVNLKAKIYVFVSSTTQRWPNKIIKIFLIEDFFHLPPVSANLELRISPRIFEKIWNGLKGILRGWGETDSWKEPEAKISWHCPFKYGGRFPKFIWAPCHVMCTAVLIGWLRPPLPAFGLVLRGRYWSAKIDDISL